jgi:glyoxylase-like metal-dependent hydrolase (beta-lactamase superfamily II)
MTGAPVLAHENASTELQLPDYDREWLHRHGFPRDLAIDPGGVRIRPKNLVAIRGGDELTLGRLRLRLIWSVGHSYDLVCAYDPERRILFSTDQVMSFPTPLDLRYPREGVDVVADYMAAAASLKELNVDLALPGHGEPLRQWESAVSAAIRAHQAHLEWVLLATYAEASADEIGQKIGWAERLSRRLDAITRRALATARTIAFVRHLLLTDAIDSAEDRGDDVWRWRQRYGGIASH